MMNSTQGRTRARFIAALVSIPFVALGALGAAGSASASQPASDHKVTYCHATGSATNPFVVITTDKAAVVRAHANHQDARDIIPAFSYSVGKVSGTFPGLNLSTTNPAAIALGCVGGGYSGGDDYTGGDNNNNNGYPVEVY